MSNLGTEALLAGSAFAAGVVNSIAGGGTLLTFPALVAALGGGPAAAVTANVTSTLALMPGSIAGAWGYRQEMAASRRWLRVLVLPSLLGGGIGALLLTRLPDKVFGNLVPWLILVASLLMLFQKSILKQFNLGHHDTAPARNTVLAVVFAQLLIGIYGGYFGAGIGILMLSTLALMGLGDIHRMNALKTLLAACINGVSVAIFIAEGEVHWRYAAVMAVAAIVGGYSGARVARRCPPAVVRGIVVAIGLSLSTYYFARQILG